MSLIQWLQLVPAIAVLVTIIWGGYVYFLEPIHSIIKRELRPNGGSSMLDRITKLEHSESSQLELLKSIDDKLTQHLEYSSRQDGRLEEHLRSHNHASLQ